MDAVVYPQPDGFHVSLRVDDDEVDDAGPFDELNDAVQTAKRTADSVDISPFRIGAGVWFKFNRGA